MPGARPDTWMPWYIGDFLRDTMHLDAEQDGAYRRLIDACWLRGGTIPDDDGQLAMIAKLPVKRWRAVKSVVLGFFQPTDGGWAHKRVTEELRKASLITRTRSSVGAAGGTAKWGSSADSSNREKRSSRLAAARQKGTHTNEEWSTLIDICGTKCVRCGSGDKLVKDHIVPIYKGGSDAIENLQPLCASCNSSKGQDETDFRQIACQNWHELLAKRLAKRLANACKMPGPSPSPSPSPSPKEPPTESQNLVGASAPGDGYAFSGRVIRVTHADLDKFCKQFKHLNGTLEAEVAKADAYYSDNPPKGGKWWFPLIKWLAKADKDSATEAQPEDSW